MVLKVRSEWLKVYFLLPPCDCLTRSHETYVISLSARSILLELLRTPWDKSDLNNTDIKKIILKFDHIF